MPTAVIDALCKLALARGVPLAEVVRAALLRFVRRSIPSVTNSVNE